MKSTRILTGTALILSLAMTGSAFAKGGHGGRGGPGERASFESLDTNGDGRVTAAEMESMAAERFATADTNGDGLLSRDELIAAAAASAEERRERHLDRMLERRDANGDGLLSPDEMGGGERRARMFERLDSDGDGAISEEEFAEARDKGRGMRKRSNQ